MLTILPHQPSIESGIVRQTIDSPMASIAVLRYDRSEVEAGRVEFTPITDPVGFRPTTNECLLLKNDLRTKLSIERFPRPDYGCGVEDTDGRCDLT